MISSGIGILRDPALIEYQYSVRKSERLLGIVRDYDRRKIILAGYIFYPLLDRFLYNSVESRKRFVQEQKLRLYYESSRKRDPLFLSSRKLAYLFIQMRS